MGLLSLTALSVETRPSESVPQRKLLRLQWCLPLRDIWSHSCSNPLQGTTGDPGAQDPEMEGLQLAQSLAESPGPT